MKFQEPKAEFVSIDLSIATTTVSNCDQTNSKRGSVETCTGPDAPYNACCDGSSAFFD